MSFIALALLFLGAILSIIGGFWGLILAFGDHFLWGLAYLLVPFASLAFFILRWGRKSVRQAFWLWLSGLGMALLGSLLSVLIGRNLPLPASSMLHEEALQLPDEAARVLAEPAASISSISSAAAAPEALER